jgi:hypothetical protein
MLHDPERTMHRDHPQQSQAASHINTDHPGAGAAAQWSQGCRPRRFEDDPRITARARYDAHAHFPLPDWLSGAEVDPGVGQAAPRRWGAKILLRNPVTA